MPSREHELLLLLLKNRPQLAAELLREVLQVEPPPYANARIGSAELSEIDPVQYHADLVVILDDDAPVLGIVVEVQLARDKDKRFVWPVYVVNSPFSRPSRMGGARMSARPCALLWPSKQRPAGSTKNAVACIVTWHGPG
jgi:hypothetical protein